MSKIRTIIVDDDRTIVEVLSDFLEMMNFEVVGKCHDGMEGLKLFKKFKPDIVLLDMKMPEYGGKFCLQNIRKIDPNARVILVTGEVGARDDPEIIALKPSAIIIKPFDAKKIIKTIQEILIM